MAFARICKELKRALNDGIIQFHTDRLCDRFSSDYTTRTALRCSIFKMPCSSLMGFIVPDNTFHHYYQVHICF